MRIVTWNVNGIRNPFSYAPWNEARSYAHVFATLGADIVCLQELKIQRKDLNDDVVHVPGWEAFFTLPQAKKGYSGVAIYVRKDCAVPIKAEQGITGRLPVPSASRAIPIEGALDGLSSREVAALDGEGRTLLLDFGLFVLIGAYCPAVTTPERAAFRMDFLHAVERRIQALVAEGRQVVLVGDLNVARDEIDTVDPHESRLSSPDGTFKGHAHRQWLDRLLDPQMQCRMVDSTRCFHPDRTGMFTCWNTKINARPGNYGARIDYCLVTRPLFDEWAIGSDIMPDVYGSDHCPVYLDFRDTDSKGNILVDLINPAGVYVNGERKGRPPDPPRLAARYLDEFSRRGNLQSLFKQMAQPAKPSEPVRPRTMEKALPQTRVKTDSQQQPSVASFFHRKPKAAEVQSAKLDTHDVHDRRSNGKISGARTEKMEREGRERPGETTIDDQVLQSMRAVAAEGQEAWSSLFDSRKRRPKPCCIVHGEECIELTTKKPGANFGRNFWICSRPVGPGYDNGTRRRDEVNREYRCDYFLWSSDANKRRRAEESLK